jgi:predicted histone-like DNA-binding protein
MLVFYNKVERVNPSDPTAPKKWYAVIKSIGQVNEKEVAKQLSDETTLNPKEAEMALSQFQKILIRLLTSGQTVQLGDWGSFRLTCNSESVDTKEEVKAENIKNLNIRFSPGQDLKESIQKVTFVAAESLSATK